MTFDPSKCLQNSKGHFVPLETIGELGIARHETVCEVVAQAKELQEHMRRMKKAMFDTVTAFNALSLEVNGVNAGGEKGNLSLLSFDGKYKVQRAIGERIVFDETLNAAKALMDECLDDLTANADPQLRAIVTDAFETDKEGSISHSKIAMLCRLRVKDARWEQAVGIISKSRQVVDTSSYIRAYERGANGKFEMIVLDMAAL